MRFFNNFFRADLPDDDIMREFVLAMLIIIVPCAAIALFVIASELYKFMM